MPNGKLTLGAVNVYGDPITEPVDVMLRSQVLSQTLRFPAMDLTTPKTISGLNTVPMGLYRIEIDAPSYFGVSRFLNIQDGDNELTVTLPVDPRKVVSVDFPAFGAPNVAAEAWTLLANSTVDGLTGQALYDGLGDIPKAGFLNLVAKADRTRFVGQTGTPRSALSYITRVTKLNGDRFFAMVDPQLRIESVRAQHDGIFNLADEILHTPPDGFNRDKSFKTQDHYGNLQLSFFSGALPSNAGQFALDMDIDDAQGFDHIFQLIANIAGPTHPYNIHEILIAWQELDPRYQLVLQNAPATLAMQAMKASKPRKAAKRATKRLRG